MKKKSLDKIQKLIKEILDFFGKVSANRLPVYSACASFYIFMSFIPFLMIVVAIIPYLPVSQTDLTAIILDFIPDNYGENVSIIINDVYNHSTAALSVSIITIIWASGRGILGITQGLNEISRVSESRNFIFMRIRSAFFTLSLALGMLLMVVVSVFGSSIIKLVENYLAIPEKITNLLQYRNVVMFIILTGLFLFLFVALPNAKMKIKEQFWGAFIAALIWWIFSRIFDLYISTYNSYSMYGNFAVIIILGVWLYTGMYIMFMGAQLNQHIASRKGNK